jgi:hypothetical protein
MNRDKYEMSQLSEFMTWDELRQDKSEFWTHMSKQGEAKRVPSLAYELSRMCDLLALYSSLAMKSI